jgi:hypothetical protein
VNVFDEEVNIWFAVSIAVWIEVKQGGTADWMQDGLPGLFTKASICMTAARRVPGEIIKRNMNAVAKATRERLDFMICPPGIDSEKIHECALKVKRFTALILGACWCYDRSKNFLIRN